MSSEATVTRSVVALQMAPVEEDVVLWQAGM